MKKNMRFVKRTVSLLLAICLSVGIFSITSLAATNQNGWVKENGLWYYYENGTRYTDTAKEINGITYKFDKTGAWVNKPGWFTRDYTLYDEITGEVRGSGRRWGYIDEKGQVATGWKYIGGYWYCFCDLEGPSTNFMMGAGDGAYRHGDMIEGFACVYDGTQLTGSYCPNYAFKDSGELIMSKWIKNPYDGKWSYAKKNGNLVANSWAKVDGKWYYFGKSDQDTGYVVEITMRTGWVKLSGKWYYLGKDGAMRTGWQKVSGKWYYMKASGVMATGWQKISGKWYYLGTNGVMVTGTQTINGKTYTFTSGGVWVQ